jgi:hypothetical protein
MDIVVGLFPYSSITVFSSTGKALHIYKECSINPLHVVSAYGHCKATLYICHIYCYLQIYILYKHSIRCLLSVIFRFKSGYRIRTQVHTSKHFYEIFRATLQNNTFTDDTSIDKICNMKRTNIK